MCDDRPDFLNLSIEVEAENGSDLAVSGGEYWDSDAKGIVLTRACGDGSVELAAARFGNDQPIETDGPNVLAHLRVPGDKAIDKIVVRYKVRTRGNQQVQSGAVTISGDALFVKPEAFALRQNRPNPFNSGTEICYDLPAECNVSVTIYSIMGQHVATLVSKRQKAGHYRVLWDGSGMGTGIYVCRLEACPWAATKRMVLLK